MFDVLIYLFENFPQATHFPAIPLLARKLTAVGFESGDIAAALKWLAELENQDQQSNLIFPVLTIAPSNPGNPMAHPADARVMPIRLYAECEQARLSVECRSFLHFMEQAGAIDVPLREMIVERAMALGKDTLSLSRLKIIALMVLWRRHPAMESINALLLDELLVDEDSTPCLH